MDSKLTDSAFPITIGEKLYQASMLTDRDYGDLQEWAQSAFIKKAINAVKKEDSEYRKEVIAVALKESHAIEYGTELYLSLIWSEEGRIYSCWVMLRKRHPKLSFEEFRERYLRDRSDSDEQFILAFRKMNEVIMEASGGASTGNTKSGQE